MWRNMTAYLAEQAEGYLLKQKWFYNVSHYNKTLDRVVFVVAVVVVVVVGGGGGGVVEVEGVICLLTSHSINIDYLRVPEAISLKEVA